MSRPSSRSPATSRASPGPSVSIHAMSRPESASRTASGSQVPPPEEGLQITRAFVFEPSTHLALRCLHAPPIYPGAGVNIAAGKDSEAPGIRFQGVAGGNGPRRRNGWNVTTAIASEQEADG